MNSETHDDVQRLLDGFEKSLNPAEQEDIRRFLVKTCMWEDTERAPVQIFFPLDRQCETLYPVSEAVDDPAKMLANELRAGQASVESWLMIRDDHPLQVRPDFGIGLIASVFGARLEVVDNNPPWVNKLFDDEIETNIEKLLDSIEIDRTHELGWIPRVIETLDYFNETFLDYPSVSKCVAIIMPDLQGPFDTAAMLWGSSIFRGLYECPDIVDKLLKTVSDVMVHVNRHLHKYIGNELLPEGFCHQHGSIIRGNLMLRCDSNLMISPEMYKERVWGHDISVLKRVGCGSYHSCGNWERNVVTIIESDVIGSLDFGIQNFHFNDFNALYKLNTGYKKHFNMVGITPEELTSGSVIDRFPRGVTCACEVNDCETAVKIMDIYRSKSRNLYV